MLQFSLLLLQVILAELKKTNQFYAIKILTKVTVLEDNDVEATLVERRLLELGSQCPFIACLFCAFQSSVCPAIRRYVYQLFCKYNQAW